MAVAAIRFVAVWGRNKGGLTGSFILRYFSSNATPLEARATTPPFCLLLLPGLRDIHSHLYANPGIGTAIYTIVTLLVALSSVLMPRSQSRSILSSESFISGVCPSSHPPHLDLPYRKSNYRDVK